MKKDIIYETALAYAIKHDMKSKAEELMTMDIDYNAIIDNTSNFTLLDYAVAYCKSDYVSLFLNKSARCNFLIKPNTDTTLHIASSHGNADIIRKLIDTGISVNISNKNGFNSLHMACIYGKYENVKCLVKNNIDITTKNNEGKTALDLAIHYNRLDIVSYLETVECLK